MANQQVKLKKGPPVLMNPVFGYHHVMAREKSTLKPLESFGKCIVNFTFHERCISIFFVIGDFLWTKIKIIIIITAQVLNYLTKQCYHFICSFLKLF